MAEVGSRESIEQNDIVLAAHLRLARLLVGRAEEALCRLDPDAVTVNGACRMAEIGAALATDAIDRLRGIAKSADPWEVIARELSPNPAREA